MLSLTCSICPLSLEFDCPSFRMLGRISCLNTTRPLTSEFFASKPVRGLQAIWRTCESVSDFLQVFVLELEAGASEAHRQSERNAPCGVIVAGGSHSNKRLHNKIALHLSKMIDWGHTFDRNTQTEGMFFYSGTTCRSIHYYKFDALTYK